MMLTNQKMKSFSLIILVIISIFGFIGCNRFGSGGGVSPAPYPVPTNGGLNIPPGQPQQPGSGTGGAVTSKKKPPKTSNPSKKTPSPSNDEDDEEISLTPPQTEGGNNQYTYFDFYQLTGDGCDKSRHEFGSMTSKQDVINQLCEALQDDSVNSFRCEEERKKIFFKMCRGREYVAKNSKVSNPSNEPILYPNTNTNTNPNAPNQNKAPKNAIDTLEEVSEDEVLKAIDSLRLHRFTSTYSLSGLLGLEFKNGVIEDFKQNCFTYRDMSCNSYAGDDLIRANNNVVKLSKKMVFSSGVPALNAGQIVYFSTAKIKHSQKSIALVYLISELTPLIVINQIYVFQIRAQLGGRSLGEFIVNSTNMTLLMHILVNNH